MPRYVLIALADVLTEIDADSPEAAAAAWRAWQRSAAEFRLAGHTRGIVRGDYPQVFVDGKPIKPRSRPRRKNEPQVRHTGGGG